MDLFRKKSVDQLVAESTPLKRTMHTFDLTMLGIGAIIGTGIFVLTGKGALTAGPALIRIVPAGRRLLRFRRSVLRRVRRHGAGFRLGLLVRLSGVRGTDRVRDRLGSDSGVRAAGGHGVRRMVGYFNKLLEGFGLHLPVELTAAYGTNPDVPHTSICPVS